MDLRQRLVHVVNMLKYFDDCRGVEAATSIRKVLRRHDQSVHMPHVGTSSESLAKDCDVFLVQVNGLHSGEAFGQRHRVVTAATSHIE